MSLAAVQVTPNEFQQLSSHLLTHTQHRNMHLRDSYTRRRQSVLRHLHAIYATSNTEIDGAISGPGVFWRYTLRLALGRVQMQVLRQQCTPQEDARLGGRFLSDIWNRMADEQAKRRGYATYLPGRFYLQRWSPGMAPTHSNCLAAVSTGVLDQQFVSQLHPWNLKLLHP